VKLLFDENLSRRLIERVGDLFPECTHVAFVGLLTAPDVDVWNYAKEHGYTIVTADSDFYEMAITFGPPPKVIWLRECDYPTRTAEQLIRKQAIRLIEFSEDEDQAVLILKPKPI
jgi:predicted nuclease of predicted toxin-antitoxin system